MQGSPAVYTAELLSSLLNCRCQLARMPRYTRRGRGRPTATTARAVRSSPRVPSRASRVAGQQSPPVGTTQTVQPSTSGHSASVSLPPLPLNELLELVRTEVRAEMQANHPPQPLAPLVLPAATLRQLVVLKMSLFSFKLRVPS